MSFIIWTCQSNCPKSIVICPLTLPASFVQDARRQHSLASALIWWHWKTCSHRRGTENGGIRGREKTRLRDNMKFRIRKDQSPNYKVCDWMSNTFTFRTPEVSKKSRFSFSKRQEIRSLCQGNSLAAEARFVPQSRRGSPPLARQELHWRPAGAGAAGATGEAKRRLVAVEA